MIFRFVAVILTLAVLGAAQFAVAAERAECSGLFANVTAESSSSALRTASPDRVRWINERVGEVNLSLKKSENYRLIQQFYRNLWDKPSDGDRKTAAGISVWLRDLGLGKATEIVMQKDRSLLPKVLQTSLRLQRNNTAMPKKVQISPDGRFISAAISRNGSIDSYTQILFDSNTGSEIGRVENVRSESFVWMQPGVAFFQAAPTFEEKQITISSGRIAIQDFSGWPPSDAMKGKVIYTSASQSSEIRRFEDGPDQAWNTDVGRITDVAFFDGQKAIVVTKGDKNFGDVKVVRKIRSPEHGETFQTETLVKESNRVISCAEMYGNALVVASFRGQDRSQQIFNEKGNLVSNVRLPLSSKAELKNVDLITGEATYLLSSPIRNGVEWKYDFVNNAWLIEREGHWVRADVAKEMLKAGSVEFVVEYVNFRSADGQEVPMRITKRKDLQPNGNNPMLVEGYGGFGTNSYFHPSYKEMLPVFLKNGGIHLAPALRGSSYFGKRWHDDGRQFNKQNVINDLAGSIEAMISAGWTSPKLVAISGESHGGLVVGAVLTQRPELIGLAITKFGPHDLARKAELDPISAANQKSEYGDLINDPTAIAYAHKLSPYDNVKPADYPMTVVMTGRQDSRVNPEHSYLFAEKLKANQTGTEPIYLYALKNAGHFSYSASLQDNIAWQFNSVYWTFIFDYFKMTAQ
jgi:prolyl oligopeptidase PreP (S9A serine peptidase family)